MAQGITVDVSARITGYEQSLKQLRTALNQIKPGEAVGQDLNRIFSDLENKIKQLSKNPLQKFTSDSQITDFTNKVQKIDELFQNIGERVGNLNFSQLDLSQSSDEIKALINEWNKLQEQLQTKQSTDFSELISNSKEARSAFKALGIDLKDVTSDNAVGILTDGLEDLRQKAANITNTTLPDMRKELQQLKNERDNLADKPILNINPAEESAKLTAAFKEINPTFSINETNFNDFRAKILNMLENAPEKIQAKTAEINAQLTKIGDSSTKQELQENFKALQKIYLEVGVQQNKLSSYGVGPGVNESNINKLFSENLDVNAIKQHLEVLKRDIETAGIKLNEKDLVNIDQSALTGKFDAIEKIIRDKFVNIKEAAKNELNQATQAVTDYQQKIHETELERDRTRSAANRVEKGKEYVTDAVKNVSPEIEQLKIQIQELENKIQELTVGRAGKELSQKSVTNFQQASEEANKYSNELEKVRQREQLVGKIEGIVQRWFSIYAAVRMVSSAIKSMISTIKELDKTITDIAIVTDMSQADLWGQMPQYTTMAKEYAVSISGVYKVSQLFYQQGLQTADVMRLSAETLKLARIAGIDYADAANYMTNAVRSFKMEMADASKVTDTYSALAAASATSVSELAEAMSKTASSAYGVGASLENTAAMIAVMTEATRESASNIGSALKSIISRYGEMKASPKDIINIDGEEASFNKVDTALKSIGISLKDTQGQFRNFDDVIMELSSIWDTLDNNTQRYIATIMAGNRQQSRFLALVSSGERLKELSTIAAESEDAATMQFLKTLDSVEAKTQQLQTSLQNLYVGTGLEQLYKILLDMGANVLNYYNGIADTVGNGITGAIAAIVTFGAQFYNLAKIVRIVLNSIKTQYVARQKQISMFTELAAKKRAGYELTEQEKALAKILQATLRNEKLKTKIHAEGAEERAQIDINAATKMSTKDKWGMAGSAISVGSGMIGTMIGGQTGALIGGGGQVIGGIIQLATGNVVGGIMSLIGGLGSLASAIETTAKKIKRLKEEATQLSNEASQARQEQKNIESNIEKIKELEKTRYESEKNLQQYQEAVNNLASSFPEMIKGYDEAGNAIIEASKAEDALTKAREKTRKATYDAAAKELEVQYTEFLSNASDMQYKEWGKVLSNAQSLQSSNNGIANLKDFIDTRKISYYVKNMAPEQGASLQQQRNLIDASQELTEAETQFLQYIDKFIAAYNNLDMSWENYTPSVVSSFLYSNYANKYSFIEGSTGISQLATDYYSTTMIKSNMDWGKYKDAQDWKNLSHFEKLYNQLSAFPEQLELFDKMILNPTLYSFEDINKQFGDIISTDKNFQRVIKNYYSSTVNDATARLNDGMNQLQSQTKEFGFRKFYTELKELKQQGYTFTQSEVDFYLNTASIVADMARSGLKNSADAFYNNFISNENQIGLAKIIQDLGPDIKSSFFSLWQEYGFTTKQGIQSIIDSLKESYQLTDEDPIIQRLVGMRDTLVENITLSMQIAAEDFSASWEKDSQKFSNFKKGVKFTEIAGIIASAEKLGVILGYDDFIQDGENFILNAEKYNIYIEEYFKQQRLVSENWVDFVNKVEKFVTNNQINEFFDSDIILEDKEFLKELGFDITNESLIKNEKLTKEGIDTLKNLILAAHSNYETYNWLIQQANNNLAKQYIEVGNIEEAIKLLMPNANDSEIQSEIAMLAEGNYTEVSELIQPYLSSFINYFNNINKSFVDAFTNSLSGKGAQVIDVTKDNEAFLKKWEETFNNFVSISNGKATINFSNADLEDLKELRQQILAGELTLTETEEKSILATIDEEIYNTRNYGSVINAVAETFQEIDKELAERYAKYILGYDSLKSAVEEGELVFDSITGKYSITLQQLREQVNQNHAKFNNEQLAQLQDIILEVYSSAADSIIDAFNDGINNVDYTVLQQKLKEIGIQNIQGFYQRGGKWYLSEQGMYQLYSELLPKDAAAANKLLEETKKYLTDSGKACENIYKTTAKIAEIQKKLSDGRIKETKELQTQLKLYHQIAEEQLFDSKQFKTMGADIPEGIASPLAFAQNIVDFKTIGKEVQEAGYATDEQFYQLINTLHSYALKTGEEFTLWGQKINSSEESVIKAMVNFSKNAKGVDGKLQVSLKNLGGNFDFSDGIDNATNEVAKAWADYADNIANFYQGIADMEAEGPVNIDDMVQFTTDENGELKADWKGDGEDSAKAYLEGVLGVLKKGGLKEGDALYDAVKKLINTDEWDITQFQQLASIIETLKDFDSDEGITSVLDKLEEIFENPLFEDNKFDLELNLTLNGENKIEDAEKLAELIEKYTNYSETGGATINGKIGEVSYTLEIGADGTISIVLNGTTYTYDEETDIITWLQDSYNAEYKMPDESIDVGTAQTIDVKGATQTLNYSLSVDPKTNIVTWKFADGTEGSWDPTSTITLQAAIESSATEYASKHNITDYKIENPSSATITDGSSITYDWQLTKDLATINTQLDEGVATYNSTIKKIESTTQSIFGEKVPLDKITASWNPDGKGGYTLDLTQKGSVVGGAEITYSFKGITKKKIQGTNENNTSDKAFKGANGETATPDEVEFGEGFDDLVQQYKTIQDGLNQDAAKLKQMKYVTVSKDADGNIITEFGINISGTATTSVQFAIKPGTNSSNADAEVSKVLKFLNAEKVGTALKNHTPKSVTISGDAENGYILTFKDIQVNGTSAINYSFDISDIETDENGELTDPQAIQDLKDGVDNLKVVLDGASNKIQELYDLGKTNPNISYNSRTKTLTIGGDLTIKGIKVTYGKVITSEGQKFTINDVNSELNNVISNINTVASNTDAKEVEIDNNTITLKDDIVVNGVKVKFKQAISLVDSEDKPKTETEIIGDLIAANTTIGNIKTKSNELNTELATLTGTVIDDKELYPDPVKIDASMTLEVTDNGIFLDGKRYDTLDKALETIKAEMLAENENESVEEKNQQIEELQQELEIAKKGIENLDKIRVTTEEENGILRLSNHNLQTALAQKTEENATLQGINSSLTAENTELEKQNANLTNMNITANATIADLMKENNTLYAQNDTLTKTNATSDAIITGLTTGNEELRKQIDTLNQDKTTLESTITNLEQQNAELKAQNEALQPNKKSQSVTWDLIESATEGSQIVRLSGQPTKQGSAKSGAIVQAAFKKNKNTIQDFISQAIDLDPDSEDYSIQIEKLYTKLQNSVNKQDWAGISGPIGDGLLSNLVKTALIEKKSEDFSEETFNQFCVALKINSPAKTMIPIGEAIAEGIGVGIASGNLTPYINKLIQKSLGNVVVTSNGSGKTLDDGSQAKGNAQAKGTLMGELGPELYVTGGHYYVAGQNGAEFVDLPNDAIVFNHLQTKRLMSTGSAGRGSAIGGEKKAVAHASGNVAMASAQDMANKWRGIAEMFRNLGKISASDLAKGGGKNGGGNGAEGINLHDLDRWYNLMRQIEKVEEQITYQQKLRENMRNGSDYIKSMEYELALLEKEQANYQLLAKLQKSYYEARRKDQEKSIYGKIFTYDSDGLMQYRDGAFRDALAKMEEQRTTGVMKYTNAQQKQILTNYLRAQGVSQKQINAELNYKVDGTKVANDKEWIENFWDKFDGWIEEMDSMYDSYTEYQTKVQEMIAEQNKILEEYRDLQLDLEGQLLQAVEDREQAIIDKLQDTYDAINESSQKYIDGLSDALSREQDMYNRNQENQELTQLQRRLAILQRSGGSGSEILSLQKQIEAQMQDRYFSEQQSQIDAIKEASDAQLEKLQQQIDIAQETLEYQKENGLFWAEVTSMMQQMTPTQLAEFIKANSQEMFGKSPLDVQTTMEKTLMDFEKWYELRNRFGAFNEFYDNEMTNDVLQKKYGVNVKDKDELTRARAIAKEAYQRYYTDEAFAKNYKSAEDAARAALLEEKNRKATKTVNATNGVSTASSSSKSSADGVYHTREEVYKAWDAAMKEYNAGVNNRDLTKIQKAYKELKRIFNGYSAAMKASNKQLPKEYKSLNDLLSIQTGGHGYNYIYNGQIYSNDGFSSKAEAERTATQSIEYYVPVKDRNKIKVVAYDIGGMVDQTGPAIVHAKEGVLTPEQVDQLRKLTSSNTDSLQYKLAELQQQLASIAVPLTTIADNTNNSVIIENATVEMNVQSIANDYDARRAGQQALEEMLKIARKTSVQSIRR